MVEIRWVSRRRRHDSVVEDTVERRENLDRRPQQAITRYSHPHSREISPH